MGMRTLTQKCELGFGTILDIVMSNDKERLSLIPAFAGNKKLGYGPPTTLVVAPPSSGEESEDELPIPNNDPVIQKMTPVQVKEYNEMVAKCKYFSTSNTVI